MSHFVLITLATWRQQFYNQWFGRMQLAFDGTLYILPPRFRHIFDVKIENEINTQNSDHIFCKNSLKQCVKTRVQTKSMDKNYEVLGNSMTLFTTTKNLSQRRITLYPFVGLRSLSSRFFNCMNFNCYIFIFNDLFY